jgi:hypothetical protein
MLPVPIATDSQYSRHNEHSLDSLRPHSNKPYVTQNLENKDWKSVIDTVQINRNSSRNSLNAVSQKNIEGDKRPMTDRFFIPEEIKAMMAKKPIHREEPRNYAGIQNIEVIKHTEPTGQPSISIRRDVELKQSYFHQPLTSQTID